MGMFIKYVQQDGGDSIGKKSKISSKNSPEFPNYPTVNTLQDKSHPLQETSLSLFPRIQVKFLFVSIFWLWKSLIWMNQYRIKFLGYIGNIELRLFSGIFKNLIADFVNIRNFFWNFVRFLQKFWNFVTIRQT